MNDSGSAVRYRGRMPTEVEHQPGEQAAATGHYEELNIFGSPTGKTAHAEQGERLPIAPHGFTWRRVQRDGC
jgi:hypothetical protein